MPCSLIDPCIANERRATNGKPDFKAFGADLLTIGERIVNLERMYNVRQGLSRTDDYLPERFTTESAPLYEFEPNPDTGDMHQSAEPLRVGQIEDFDGMLDRYYDLRGWSREGIPTQSTLERLELEECLSWDK